MLATGMEACEPNLLLHELDEARAALEAHALDGGAHGGRQRHLRRLPRVVLKGGARGAGQRQRHVHDPHRLCRKHIAGVQGFVAPVNPVLSTLDCLRQMGY